MSTSLHQHFAVPGDRERRESAPASSSVSMYKLESTK